MKRLFSHAALVLVLDQLSKWWIRHTMSLGESHDFLPFFSLTYIENHGAAFGLFEGRAWLLILVTCLVLGLLFYYYRLEKDKHMLLDLSTAWIASGAIGNLIDRLYKQSVTDMFNLHWWPVFNIADIAVTVGCLMLGIYILRYSEH